VNKASNDTAGVIAPPPLLALVIVIAGLGLDQIAPIGHVAKISTVLRYCAAALLLGLAAFVSLRATRAFGRKL
jgi:hypothetical protein